MSYKGDANKGLIRVGPVLGPSFSHTQNQAHTFFTFVMDTDL